MFTSTDEFSDNIDKLILHLITEDLKDDFFKELVKTCDSANPLHQMIRDHLSGVVRPSGTASKGFTYANSIISLYGYLESYLEKLADDFISSINEARIPISALPEAVKCRHLELSMQFLKKVSWNKKQDEVEKRECEKQVVANLHSFFQEADDYTLNSKAFTVHTANFRYELIQSYFAQLGEDRIADRTLGISVVPEKLAVRLGQDVSEDKEVLKSWLESELSELAQLRNEIAHGSFEGSIESIDLIIERAEFLKHFGVALGSILYRSFEEVVFHGKKRKILGNADKAFAQASCFGFKGKVLSDDEDTFTIKVGDEIYAHNAKSSDKLLKGSVQGLVLNQEHVDEIEFPNMLDCGIKVNFVVASTMTNREISLVNKI
ncbi:MAE_28990/MAE_18760 family HEPN-like nuclease [Shewanella sp. TB4-MNA-CIBAN-0142]|uniref:MAE_28990/MAE_18760 family HEPN-like nuclease n=1 Tax=Shewanella sp. TB4-MNA-CIBAN-0142 TaxID=3140464 RepID=UPI0033280228